MNSKTIWDVVSAWDWNTIWTAIGALATAAAAYLIYFAGKQLRFEAWLRAQEIFVEKEFTEARTRLFRHIEESGSTWSPKDEEDGLLVCRRLDEICRLAPYFAFTQSGGDEVILQAWDERLAMPGAFSTPFSGQSGKRSIRARNGKASRAWGVRHSPDSRMRSGTA